MPLPRKLFDNLPAHHSAVEMQRILEIDHKANHAGRSYDVSYSCRVLRLWRESGGMIFCAPNVMFIIQEQSHDTVEFHSVNGGTAKNLTAGVNALLSLLAVYYPYAATYYDNPRVNDLLKHADYPSQLTRLDAGEDRTFEAKFRLRSH